MKKVLILSYAWPPKGPVGMIRTVRFAKYLIRAGNRVSVIAGDNGPSNALTWDIDEPLLEQVPVCRIASGTRRGIKGMLYNKLSPQFEYDWVSAVTGGIDTALAGIDFDVVVSSSPPEGVHMLASLIKKKTHKPWIADLRDLWAYDHYRRFGSIRRSILTRMEKKILAGADHVVTVSETWAAFLRKLYGFDVKVITNGYDEDYFSRIPYGDRRKFVVSYLGKLNGDCQDADPLFRAMSAFIGEHKVPGGRFEADFYVSGYRKPDITALAARYGLSDHVREYAPVPLGESYTIMRQSSLLLIIGWDGISASGWRPQKLYEYVGAGNPLLLVNGRKNAELQDIITGSRCGTCADTEAAIRAELERYYGMSADDMNRWRENRDKGFLRECSAECVTRRLSELMDR
ncbi:MAG: glycosyltransferase family 4 protein [Candidatus Omnitrophica bacterium]|nr:glycosyltransferase family 4 protein [Candidatus Omnitrophota bacterium]